MTRSRTVTISRPFDARHVGGVSVPGATVPIVGVQRSNSTLEPDEIPTHMNISANPEAPKRSNTIAHSLSRPSLRLKTSISRLRGRSSSNSPDTYRRKERDSTPNSRPEPEPVMSSHPITAKKLPTRPKRADSGTAIDFDDVPADERPLGFKEILAVRSFSERMALYQKTRDYWASADHGLDEWVERAAVRKPLAARV
ncbi:hypothetical protein K491DRAFT_385041 [Lophiostoma macrostomum CBS 122681]|uniref:Uncharacterized protein n=1 Tax=Lophiostoma macrostomum CBS 122681 TaxID=1314788 RepID=A0A6A6TS73_9PLEO|nr:hypothetical protein K491DRAFT_385041 [Lophiostoma macrostomum CBS 122681]